MTGDEQQIERALRPKELDEFSGQAKIVENLRIFIAAARQRGEALDHVLLHGPPGLGKTTLSYIISNELGSTLKMSSGPVLEKPGDLAGLLTNLEEGDVLFIDEIHRLNNVVEEYLYSAMEDYRIDIMIDSGPNARSIQIALNQFTLVGATTRMGLLTAPMRSRFGITCHLDYYDVEVLKKIIKRSAAILKVPITEDGAFEIARRSRGTPRIANLLLRRIRDFAQIKGNGTVDVEISKIGLSALNVDEGGLNEMDNKMDVNVVLWDKFECYIKIDDYKAVVNGKGVGVKLNENAAYGAPKEVCLALTPEVTDVMVPLSKHEIDTLLAGSSNARIENKLKTAAATYNVCKSSNEHEMAVEVTHYRGGLS